MPESKHEKRADELLREALRLESSWTLIPEDRTEDAYLSLVAMGFIKPSQNWWFSESDYKPAIDFLVAKGYMREGGVVTDQVLQKLSDFYKCSADKADDGKRNNSLSDNYDRLGEQRGKYSAEFNDAQGIPNTTTPKAIPAPTLKV